jgi:hypothetical protein
MSKYIIELEDDIKYIIINGRADNRCYTLVRPVAELEELNSDYINEHFGELQDEAYKRDYEEGRKVGIKDGMCEAWEAASKIFGREVDGGLSIDELKKAFGSDVYCTADIIRTNTAEQAIAKLKAFEEKENDAIKVDDCVYEKETDPRDFGVVTWASKDSCYVMWKDGSSGVRRKELLRKTGKRYDIQSILEAMRE